MNTGLLPPTFCSMHELMKQNKNNSNSVLSKFVWRDGNANVVIFLNVYSF